MQGTEQHPHLARPIHRALVLADDPWLRRALRRALREAFACSVDMSSRLRCPTKGGFDLVLVDVDLANARSLPLVESVIGWRPRPVTIVLSANAPARSAYELGRLGVEAFVQKPLTISDLHGALAEAFARPPSLELFGRSWAGRVDFRAAQADLRRGMIGQAMDLAHGNLTRAAELLHVTRQALQRTARNPQPYETDDVAAAPAASGPPPRSSNGR